MTRVRPPIVIGLLVAIAVAGGLVVASGARRVHHQAHATYYCPMHPTYTSDRPGDCPICNMTLVKREAEPQVSAGHDHGAAGQQAESICLLHNCPNLHKGKPCPMTVVAKPGERVTCPICGTYIADTSMGKLKKILYWTDPMIPGYRAEGPGKSPMGMDLVPVYAEEAGAPAAAAPEGYAPVLLSPQKQQLIGVTTAPVERKRLTKTIRAPGVIAHDPELYQAQAEYLQALEGLAQATRQGVAPDVVEQARRLADSSRIRLKHLGLSDALIDEMAGWSAPEHSLLYAHAGDPVWLYAKIYEYELPLVRVGQELAVEVPSLPGQMFRGAIRAIDQMVDPATRTTRVRALLQDPQGQLKPDMYVNTMIAVDLGDVLAVPEEAIFATGQRQLVFVDKGQGLFEPRDVTVGAKADRAVEITAGLVEGERVVTSGNFLLDSESRLKAARQDAGGAGHQHGQ